MSLRFFDTLTGEKRDFQPLEGVQVRMYTCGPTVYDYAHIGNFRAYLFEDLLRRYLKFKGFDVLQVMNLTDVDDKTIRGALSQGVTLEHFTEPYVKAFFEDLDALNIERAEVYPRATEHIPEMLSLIRRLKEKGHTYESEGSIYFSIATFPAYGRLSKMNLDQMRAGARVDVDEYEKADARDFALWKRAKPDEPSWESEFGPGRPGWHIECSAMSMKYLGESFDVHTGGTDNVFPHHENEIAQSEGATGKQFVNFWLHCEWLLVNGEKMAKSKGNFYTLRDLLAQGHAPMTIRFFLMSSHYRHQLNFTEDSLPQAASALQRLLDFRDRLEREEGAPVSAPEIPQLIAETSHNFIEAVDDDLNVPRALGHLFDFVREMNQALGDQVVSAQDIGAARALLEKVDTVLGILAPREEPIPEEVLRLVEEREAARRNKNYAAADQIRSHLLSLGYALEDMRDGSRVKRAGVSPDAHE